MLKFLVLLALCLTTASSGLVRNAEALTEDQVKDIIHLVFCACDQGDHDGSLTLEEWLGPVCENVNDHLFGYQVSEDDFNGADADDDGICTFEEVHDYVMTHADCQNRDFRFSDDEYVAEVFEDASIEARTRLIGCACDTNMDFMLDEEEVNQEQCVTVQNWLFGWNKFGPWFKASDDNQDGFLDGDEAALSVWFFDYTD